MERLVVLLEDGAVVFANITETTNRLDSFEERQIGVGSRTLMVIDAKLELVAAEPQNPLNKGHGHHPEE